MNPERILIIDDGKENRDFIIEYVLEPNGFNPLVARDGREGMQLVRQHQPDLILLDLQMPVMNGMQVLDALNAEGFDIPVILMTFHGSEEIAIEVYRKGVRDYVKKPYTVEEMYDAIDRSLTEIRLRREKDELTERLIAANAALNQRLRELNVLYNIGKSVTALLNMDTLLHHVAKAAAQLTSCEESSVFLLENEHLICKTVYRGADNQTYLVNEARHDSFAEQAVRSASVFVPTEADLQQARRSNPSAPTAAIATPLMIAERPVGALVVKNLSGGARLFTRHDGGLLSALSDYAAIAVENAASHAQASQNSASDTGALNGGDKEIVRKVLRRAVKTGILNEVLADPDTRHAQGMRREISLLSGELHGYHLFARKGPPEQVVSLLNDYLGLVTDIMLAHSGTLEHVSGDDLMVLFNAPTRQEQHPEQALYAALALQAAVQKLHQERGGGLMFGLGLHFGRAIIGYLGTGRTVSYTAVGEAATVGRHLQLRAKPGQILLTEPFAHHVKHIAELRPVAKLPMPKSEGESLLVLEFVKLRP